MTLFLARIEKADSIDEGVFKDILKEIEKETGLKGGRLYHPLRAALTGQLQGPELKMIIPVLDAESCAERIKRALKV